MDSDISRRVAGYGARLFTTSVRYAMCNAATSMHFFASVALAVHAPMRYVVALSAAPYPVSPP